MTHLALLILTMLLLLSVGQALLEKKIRLEMLTPMIAISA